MCNFRVKYLVLHFLEYIHCRYCSFSHKGTLVGTELVRLVRRGSNPPRDINFFYLKRTYSRIDVCCSAAFMHGWYAEAATSTYGVMGGEQATNACRSGSSSTLDPSLRHMTDRREDEDSQSKTTFWQNEAFALCCCCVRWLLTQFWSACTANTFSPKQYF